MIRAEHLARLQHAKSDVNELAHRRTDDLDFVFIVASQALTEAAKNRVLPRMGPERLFFGVISGLTIRLVRAHHVKNHENEKRRTSMSRMLEKFELP